MTQGPRRSRPSATAPAKAAMASIVVRMARANASCPAVASSPERWGSREVWTAWKSCSGARVMSSALKTTPARTAPDVPRTVSTAALSSVCSASWIPATASANPAPARRDRLAAPRSSSASDAPAAPAVPARVAHEHGRHHEQGDERGGDDPQRDGGLPGRQAHRDGDREAEARDRLEEHEAAVEPEPAVAGDVAAGEVARGVGERRPDEDPVQRAGAEEVLELGAQRERDDEEDEREPRLQRERHAQRVRRGALGPAAGDRPREELLDRAVDDRDDDEQHRPQQGDLAVLAVAQDVAGDGEVREGEDAGGGDAHRQHPRPAGVGGVRTRPGRTAAASPGSSSPQSPTRTRSIVQGNGDRASTTSPWRLSSATKARRLQWLRCPGVLPRSRT